MVIFFTRLVIIVTRKVHNWVRLLKTSLPSRLHSIFWNCEGSCDQSICPVTRYYCQILVGNKNNVRSLYWVWGGWFSRTPLTNLLNGKYPTPGTDIQDSLSVP